MARKMAERRMKSYKFHFMAAVVCILGAALATQRGILFMQVLIDDYILPLAGTDHPRFGPLAAALLSLAGTYLSLIHILKDARQYTVPVDSALASVRAGENPELTTRQLSLIHI